MTKTRLASLVGVLLVGVLIGHFLHGQRMGAAAPKIIFSDKMYFDNPTDPDTLVCLVGTLAGEGLGYKENSTAITCYKDRMVCAIVSVQQISDNWCCQIGRLESPLEMPVTTWNASEIVSIDDGGGVACAKTTISIDRRPQTALWVQEPINQGSLYCVSADTKLYKWMIK
jgi:hypothetical protein